MTALAVILILGLSSCQARLIVSPLDKIRLEDEDKVKTLFMGLADAAAYDADQQLLYVVGTKTDMLNVVDVADKNTLKVPFQQRFSDQSDGLPLDVAVCRASGANQVARLAVSFASKDRSFEGYVEVFDLLDRNNFPLKLTQRYKESVPADPKSIAFSDNCNLVVVANEGLPGRRVGNVAYDPVGHATVLSLEAGSGVSSKIYGFAGDNTVTRQVNNDRTFGEDIEPEVVVVGSNNTAYVFCQENNAVGGFDMDVLNPITLHDLGFKDFSSLGIDTSNQDTAESPANDGIHLATRNVRAFYQPGDAAVFSFGGEDFLLTADQGAQKKWTAGIEGWDFSESQTGDLFQNNILDPNTLGQSTILDMQNLARLGQLEMSLLRQPFDGFDNIVTQRFQSLRIYGARGFSIWKPSTLTQVYNSGGEFEQKMAEDGTLKSVFNGDFPEGSQDTNPVEQFDSRSAKKGPEPTSIVTGIVNGKRVAVIGSGRTGTLFIYEIRAGVTGDPIGDFNSIYRPGDLNANWMTLWNDNRAGHPRITDMALHENADGTADLMVTGGATGTVSLYTISDV